MNYVKVKVNINMPMMYSNMQKSLQNFIYIFPEECNKLQLI